MAAEGFEAMDAGEIARLEGLRHWKRHLLQTCVPVHALTEDHLDTLLRDTGIEAVCRGQPIVQRGDCDGRHIYLLSGSVEVRGADGGVRSLMAGDPEACHPLEHTQPRQATVIAAEDSQVVRFDSDVLDAMLAWDQAARYIELDITSRRDLDEDADWMLTLLQSNLFHKVPPMNIRRILGRFEPMWMSAGEVVLRQGELGDSCYFIKEGRVSIYRAPDERSRSELVAELGVGRCFGEDALVHEAPRNATIVMRSNGVLMRLDKQSFYLLLQPPEVRWLSAGQLLAAREAGVQLLDVRTQAEFEHGHLPGALNMPLNILKLKSRLLGSDGFYITCCNTGRRACAAAHLLSEDGYQVAALRDGLEGLPREVLAELSGAREAARPV